MARADAESVARRALALSPDGTASDPEDVQKSDGWTTYERTCEPRASAPPLPKWKAKCRKADPAPRRD